MFFFFKQKTAYEMRISDWSSDVCSSDLPLASEALLAFAHGHDEILVIEEKAPMVENQIKAALFHAPGKRPRVTGKTDEDGRTLLPTIMEFDPHLFARAPTARRAADPVGIATRLTRSEAGGTRPTDIAFPPRKRFFSSGCPTT